MDPFADVPDIAAYLQAVLDDALEPIHTVLVTLEQRIEALEARLPAPPSSPLPKGAIEVTHAGTPEWMREYLTVDGASILREDPVDAS